jgi:hypothetical protein
MPSWRFRLHPTKVGVICETTNGFHEKVPGFEKNEARFEKIDALFEKKQAPFFAAWLHCRKK